MFAKLARVGIPRQPSTGIAMSARQRRFTWEPSTIAREPCGGGTIKALSKPCSGRFTLQKLRQIQHDILATGKIDGPELEVLRRQLYIDGAIDRPKADFL